MNPDEGFASFIAIFRGPTIIDERHFERLLWSQLRRLHAVDEIPSPTLVFNLHEQFVALRAAGHYPRMRDRIRERDEQLQGTINPMVADHGVISQARQYSGREVGPDWRAPFAAERKG